VTKQKNTLRIQPHIVNKLTDTPYVVNKLANSITNLSMASFNIGQCKDEKSRGDGGNSNEDGEIWQPSLKRFAWRNFRN
jgi:hypothetical protein